MAAVLTRTLKEGVAGKDVQAVRRACLKFNGEPASTLTTAQQRTFGPGMTQLVKRAQDQAVIPKTGTVGPKLMGALRRADAFDAYGEKLLADYAAEHPKRKVPALGPVTTNGAPLLLVSLTHNTDGIPLYPAFDSGWAAGVDVLAPEAMTVTQQSGAQGADAFYAKGASGLEFWFGHVVTSPPNGRTFAKGAKVGDIARLAASDGGPHLHLGINAEALLGRGKQLLYGATGHGPDYTLGAPTVGAQMRKWAKGG